MSTPGPSQALDTCEGRAETEILFTCNCVLLVLLLLLSIVVVVALLCYFVVPLFRVVCAVVLWVLWFPCFALF